MSLHKLSAGDGYTYLTRQVAAVDSTERGYSSLGDYYAAKGESAGVWVGAQATEMGLVGTAVTEQQMKNLFGQGLHPDAQRREAQALAALPAEGSKQSQQRTVDRAGKLGAKFPVFQASPVWHENLAAAYQKYNLDAGLAKGDKVPAKEKQTIRTQVGAAMFTAEYGREPRHDHELSGFIAQHSRPGSSAVAGYDLTFSPVKSVSTLWAIAPRVVAEQLEAAHDAAVQGTLRWLESEAGYTREGAGSVSQIRIRGFLATAFTHRDSRAGDPDLHTHVAVSNKVQTADGRWLALDARMLYRYNVPASEHYNMLLEAEVTRRVGGTFAARGDAGDGKREIRELVGVPASLNEHFSSRAAMIDAHRTQLIAKFRADHGRVPTTLERIQLSQQANLATRQAKHEPTSLAQQRALWQAYPDEVCPDSPAEIVADVLGHAPQYADVTPDLVAELSSRVVQVVTASRAQWRENNLSAEARRQVKAAGIHPDQMTGLAEQVTAAATGPDYCVPIGLDTEIDHTVPAALLDVDGKAVFRMAKGQLYTSPQILDAETRICAAAGRTDAWALSDSDVDIAHLEWSANNEGRTLNTGQEAMVRQVATSGRRVQLVFGPAGTGKTTSLAVLSLAAQSRGMTVLGLAPQASAAQELAAAIPGITSDTLHKLVWHLQPAGPAPGIEPDPEAAAAAAQEAEKVAWISDIGPHHLVIIDEAGLAGTRELDVAISHITGRGGRVLLVGDDRQRAASGAGGVLRDIESAHGALQLDEVMRFTDRGTPGTGAVHGRATLAVRQGDLGSVGYYVDRGLITAVTPDTACAQVFTGWSADVAAGADSIMIAPTLDMVSDLNSRARAARLTAAGGHPGPERSLTRGEKVSAGDIIVTKKNKRVLSLGGTDFVRNNYRWRVQTVNPDGSITATELTRGLTRTLPAWYVDKGWVRLGYAHTEASVQGMTVGSQTCVGTAHAVFTDRTNRNQLYTNLSRATDRTISYGIIPGTGDSHDVTTQAAVHPETAVEMFTAVLSRDGSDRSATTTLREAADPAYRLGAPGNAALAYSHAIVEGSLHLVGPQRMQLIADTVEVLIPGITGAPAWESLRGHLATIESSGGNAVRRLDQAAMGRELGTAADLAAVVDFRLDPTGNHSLGQGPLPYLPAIPAALLTQPDWDTYLPARAALVTELAQQVRDQAFGWTLDDAPAWAIPYLQNMGLVADLAVWRAAHAVPDTDLRPAGPRPLRLALRTWHADFTDRAVRVAGDPTHGADRWAHQLTEQHRLGDITADDYFPVLAARLSLADTAGLDVPALLRRAIDDREPLPAEATAQALWWRLEPHLGSLTAGHGLPASGHRLRPAWTTQLEETLGEMDAQRIMSDRLWPTIVAQVDRAVRDGHTATLILPAAAGLFTAHRSTLPAHEMATVLLWQISAVTDPAPPDPEFEVAYPDSADDDLLVPAGAHELLDTAAGAAEVSGSRATTLAAPPVDPAMPDADPFDVDTYAAGAALVDTAYAGLDLPEPMEPELEEDEIPGGPVDELPPADLYTAVPEPVREWVHPEPPAAAVATVDPDVAPVVLASDEQEAALGRARAAIAAAQEFWAEHTPASWVPAYITSRGLDPADFRYAPAGWTATMNHLTRAGFTEQELKAAGLITLSVRGSYVDLFQDRAVTGIHHPDTGEVVAFTGRKNPDNSNERAPKYINSPTTDLFHKSELPFGLTPANVAALRAGADLAIVEGPMDALAVNRAFAADRRVVAVAASGVAFTAEHIATINRVAPNPDRRWLLVLDQDKAGQAAAVKIFPRLAAAGITHPETIGDLTGKDPAQMLHTHGPQALLESFDARRPLAELVIDTLIAKTDLTNGWVESRWRAMSDVAPFIATLPRDQIIDQSVRAAELIGWDTNRAIDQVARYIPDTPQQHPATPGDLGLPELPRLSTDTRPEPPTGPAAGHPGSGTVLTRPSTDSSIQEQPNPVRDLDLSDLEPAATADLDELDVAIVDPVEAAEMQPAAVSDVQIDQVDLPKPTDAAAALAGSESAAPDGHAQHLSAQYRNHTATEAEAQSGPNNELDVAAGEVDEVAGVSGSELGIEVHSAAATPQETAGAYADVPDGVLAEEIGQLSTRHNEAARVADDAVDYLTHVQAAVDGDAGPALGDVRTRAAANQRRLDAMREALDASNEADDAKTKTAALHVQVMETEQQLSEVRGAFANRRRAEALQHLNEVTAAHELQTAKMIELVRRSHDLTAKLGSLAQQREALTLRDQATYQTQLTEQVHRAQIQDRQAVQDAKEWAAASQQRVADVAKELADAASEQVYRAEHPDAAAELHRRQLHQLAQAAEVEAEGWEYISTWDQDLDLPAPPDDSFER